MNNNKKLIQKLKKDYQNVLKEWVEESQEESIKFFKKSFDPPAGFTDDTLIRWKRRKIAKPWSIMNKTGRLKNSIKKMGRNKWSFTIGSDVSYAKYHNEGTDRLPKRQFIGNSKKLIKLLERNLYKKIYRIFR